MTLAREDRLPSDQVAEYALKSLKECNKMLFL